jgi:hypothetical protein
MRETFYCSSCCPAGAFQGMTYLGGCNGCGRSAYCVRVESPGAAATTREDVERLKAEWLRDDWDGLEDTAGFEAFRDELKAFREENESAWAAASERGRLHHAEQIARSLATPTSLRDEFALAAMNGLLVAEAEGDEGPFRDYARAAYAVADAMLLERLKESRP